MRHLRLSIRSILDWHLRFAFLLSVICLPISLITGGLQGALLTALVVAPALFLIWLGDKLSESDAGSLLTAPLYKEVVGRVLMFLGWVLLARLLGAMVLAPLFLLLD